MKRSAFCFPVILWSLSACANLPPVMVGRDSLTAQEHAALGEAYLAHGEKPLAMQQYQAALHKDKHCVPALVALGNLTFDDHQWSRAANYFRRALKADPNNAGATNNLAMVYLADGKHLDRAKALIAKALPTAGDFTPYLLDTSAQIALREGRFVDAKRDLDEAEASAPANDPDFRKHLDDSRAKWVLATRATP